VHHNGVSLFGLILHYPHDARRAGKKENGKTVSIGERDVPGVHVHQVDAVALETPKDRLNFRPARTELLLFVPGPFRERFFGEVGRLAEIDAGEVEHERAGDDGHLDDPEDIVTGEQFGNGAATGRRDRSFQQAPIHVAFTAIVAFALMDFDVRMALFGLVFNGKYATMNTRTEGQAKNQAVPFAVFPRPEEKLRSIPHGYTAGTIRRPLRRRL